MGGCDAECVMAQVLKAGFNVQVVSEGSSTAANIITSDPNACLSIVEIIDSVLVPNFGASSASSPAPVRVVIGMHVAQHTQVSAELQIQEHAESHT